MMPALLTSTPTLPQARSTSSKAASAAPVGGHVMADHEGLAAAGADRGGDLLGGVGGAPAEQGDGESAAGQLGGHGGADSPRGAGDQRRAAVLDRLGGCAGRSGRRGLGRAHAIAPCQLSKPPPQTKPAPKVASRTREPGRSRPSALGLGEGQRQRRRRGVAELRDAVDDTLGGQPEALADGGGDPGVCLVVDEQVDVRERLAGELERLQRDRAERVDGGPEGVLAAHPDDPLGLAEDDAVRLTFVAAQDDRVDRAGGGPGPDHGGAGAVGEQPRGLAVVAVGDARGELGADYECPPCPTALDLGGGERETAEKAGAGGAEVARECASGTDRTGNQRRRVGEDAVGCEGGDEDEVDLGTLDPGGGERPPRGARAELGQRLAGSRDPPLADSGPLLDPGRLDPEALGDRFVGDGRCRQRRADRLDAGAAHGE